MEEVFVGVNIPAYTNAIDCLTNIFSARYPNYKKRLLKISKKDKLFLKKLFKIDRSLDYFGDAFEKIILKRFLIDGDFLIDIQKEFSFITEEEFYDLYYSSILTMLFNNGIIYFWG